MQRVSQLRKLGWQTWRILHERAFREMSYRYEDGRSMLRHYKGLDRPEEAG